MTKLYDNVSFTQVEPIPVYKAVRVHEAPGHKLTYHSLVLPKGRWPILGPNSRDYQYKLHITATSAFPGIMVMTSYNDARDMARHHLKENIQQPQFRRISDGYAVLRGFVSGTIRVGWDSAKPLNGAGRITVFCAEEFMPSGVEQVWMHE